LCIGQNSIGIGEEMVKILDQLSNLEYAKEKRPIIYVDPSIHTKSNAATTGSKILQLNGDSQSWLDGRYGNSNLELILDQIRKQFETVGLPKANELQVISDLTLGSGISGAILTKMDGDTRGGSALSVRGVSGKPIKFIGVGEGIDDLEPFFPNRMASRILGLGDIQSLLEKATDSIDKEQMTEIGKKMQKGQFDFNDFMAQSQSVKKIGGMANMIKMLPGVAGKITDEMIFETEKKLQKHENIIMAMTDEERSNPDLIILRGGNKEKSAAATDRRKSLAKQTGLTIDEVEGFVTEFINMKKKMQKNLKGMDVDAVNSPEGAPMNTDGMLKAEEKQAKKIKPSRGGGGGFGAR
jgi:hypothetical protein